MYFKKLNLKPIFELGCRLYVFLMLNLYGIGKMIGQQFYRKGELPDDVFNIPLGQAEAFDLAWTFMGYSSSYIFFVGISQIVGAWLLLFNKTKLIGVTILIPIMLNIVVFDIVFLDKYGALASAILYLILLISILILNKETIRKAFENLINVDVLEVTGKKKLLNLGLSIIAVILLFVFDQLFVNLFGH